MSCRRALAVFVVLLLIGLVGLHEYFVYQLKGGLQDAIRRDSGYPARIESFRGFLPAGSVWVEGFEFKTHLTEETADNIQWQFPSGSLNIRVVPLFMAQYHIDSILAPNLHWQAQIPTLEGQFQGNVDLSGHSQGEAPEGLSEETIWCETVNAVLTDLTGSWQGKSVELPPRTEVRLENLTLRDGAPTKPLHFEVRSELSDRSGGPLFLASGTQDQEGRKLRSDLRLVGVTREDLGRVLKTVIVFDPNSTLIRDLANEWIEGGSFSARLSSMATTSSVSGEVTLRIKGPRFGSGVRDEEVAGQPIGPFLDALESREDTIVIGPLAFNENLATPQTEAFDQIQRGLVAEIVKNAPGAALKTGAGLLRDFFKGK
jgi:hypothetical protein